jgi:hypothetical protein
MAPKKRQKSPTPKYHLCSSSPLSCSPATPQRNRFPSLVMEAALPTEDPITPPSLPAEGQSRVLPGESSTPVSSALLQVTPLAKHRKKKSAIRPDGDDPTAPLTIPTFLLKPEWTTFESTKALQGPTEADLVLWTPSRTFRAQAASAPPGLDESPASSSYNPGSAVEGFMAEYRTPARTTLSTPELVSDSDISKIMSPTPRLSQNTSGCLEPIIDDHLRDIMGSL